MIKYTTSEEALGTGSGFFYSSGWDFQKKKKGFVSSAPLLIPSFFLNKVAAIHNICTIPTLGTLVLSLLTSLAALSNSVIHKAWPVPGEQNRNSRFIGAHPRSTSLL